jgi:S-adenosylmethionine-diacylglycerol 3-amino-3-carboxypropyl transferase
MTTTNTLSSKVSHRSVFKQIGYASCWEDTRLLRQALEVKSGDRVLSVTSGGCNTITLLLDDPSHVTTIDFNTTQSHLIRLKIAGFKGLTHPELLELMGITASDRRVGLYQKCREYLIPEAAVFWDNHPQLIEAGLLYTGRTDRYLMGFGKVLRKMIGQKQVEDLFAQPSLEQQKSYYHQYIETFLVKRVFDIFFSKAVITRAKDASHFHYTPYKRYGRRFRERFAHCLTAVPIAENTFAALTLLGEFPTVDAYPPYLKPENFETIKNRVDRIEVVTSELERLLQNSAEGQFNKFNLSNLFDWVSDDHLKSMVSEVVRIGKGDGKLCYWNTLYPRLLPTVDGLTEHKDLSDKLLTQDQFIYANFEIGSF